MNPVLVSVEYNKEVIVGVGMRVEASRCKWSHFLFF